MLMIHTNIHQQGTHKRGFALFVAVVTASIVLAMGLSILQITLKDFTLSSVVRESELAFAAADAGMECALYWNQSNEAGVGGLFTIPSPTLLHCLGKTNITATSSGRYQIEWGTPKLCSDVTVIRVVGPSGSCGVGVCTTIVSRGYNSACTAITGSRTVERALRSYTYAP